MPVYYKVHKVRPLLYHNIPSLYGDNVPSTHINKIQVVRSKVLRVISNAQWFVRNDAIAHCRFSKTNNQKLRVHKEIIDKLFSHMCNASGSLYYRLNYRPNRRRLQRGRPYDVFN